MQSTKKNRASKIYKILRHFYLSAILNFTTIFYSPAILNFYAWQNLREGEILSFILKTNELTFLNGLKNENENGKKTK
jgi:hypothetical protein